MNKTNQTNTSEQFYQLADQVIAQENSILARTDEVEIKSDFKSKTLTPEELNKNKPKKVGLALSGGGIRSASFATGVIQAFLNHQDNHHVGAFARLFKYLSTVSGGGYLGAALTWLKSNGHDLDEELSTSRGARNRLNNKTWLDYVRQHGSYLKPKSISSLSLLSVVLRNMLTSFLVYFSLLVLLFFVFRASGLLSFEATQVESVDQVGQVVAMTQTKLYSIPSFFLISLGLCGSVFLLYPVATYIGSFKPLKFNNGLLAVIQSQSFLGLLWLIAMTIVTISYTNNTWPQWGSLLDAKTNLETSMVVVFCLFFITFFSLIALITTIFNEESNRISSHNYRSRLIGQQRAGLILGITLTLALITALPYLFNLTRLHLIEPETTSLIAGLAGLMGSVLQFTRGRSKEVDRGINTNLLIIVSSALLIFSLFLGAYTFVFYHHAMLEAHLLWFITIVIFISIFINLNYFGIGRMYRDRIMETFMPNKESIEKGQWGMANQADKTPITAFKNIRPFHIINTNVVLVDSDEERYRGRGGDNFIISPAYCGSEATGYLNSEMWFNGRMNLPTAVSISGAAINPNSGVSGKGVTKNRLVSFILALLQIRLGYWAPNPEMTEGKLTSKIKFFLTSMFRANFIIPGIRQGLFGRGLHSKAYWLELTDGGHFDNTGAYELIRRELDVIVISLASADPDYKFEDLANLIQKARVDFGTRIHFKAADFNALKPDPKTGLSAKSYAIAQVVYPNNKEGQLVLLSANKNPNISAEIISYASNHPEFPHQSTSDQFYDEQQFEVYRELGQLIGSEFLNGPEVNNGLFFQAPKTSPAATTQSSNDDQTIE
ncbi:hypothetical protein ACFODZ_07460 [Marinicella sediminis]|uniref:PNPLA domain-containing protein n=1 Tax=Marinicella sediminis TaxID=1792834 RepID=A0ABV7J7G5_9GAMM|nr:hypothetical protein [Marinicella sediminis]